jgi:single-strand DNA-binding protein
MYFNKAFIIGNLTRDPELKTLPSGASVTTFSLATNRVYNDKDGNKQEDTQFHNIVVFGRQAETSAQYLKKGNLALVEGRLQTRSWDDKETGKKNYRTEIVADRVQFGPKGSGGGGAASSSSAPKKEELKTIEYPEEEINPDDIPF